MEATATHKVQDHRGEVEGADLYESVLVTGVETWGVVWRAVEGQWMKGCGEEAHLMLMDVNGLMFGRH